MEVSPYYEDDSVTIYHGDCREVGDWLKTGHVFILDPPYGMGTYATDCDVLTGSLLRQMVDCGTTAVFGYPEQLVGRCLDANLIPDEWITWWPPNKSVGHVGQRLPRETEHVAVFGEVPGAKELRRPRAVERYGRDRVLRMGLDPDFARLGDVWTDPSPGARHNFRARQHPNEKPLSLMVKLVTLCSEVGGVVADPFAGSGTTLVAAKQLGRRAIGIEVERRFCEIAARRCSQEVLAVA